MNSIEQAHDLATSAIRNGQNSGTVTAGGHRWRYVGELIGQTVHLRLCRPVSKRVKMA